jgi:hypothetical protein
VTGSCEQDHEHTGSIKYINIFTLRVVYDFGRITWGILTYVVRSSS